MRAGKGKEEDRKVEEGYRKMGKVDTDKLCW